MWIFNDHSYYVIFQQYLQLFKRLFCVKNLIDIALFSSKFGILILPMIILKINIFLVFYVTSNMLFFVI